MRAPTIPVVLFVYDRPAHLRMTLKGLRVNNVPLLWVFSDGPKIPECSGAVEQVRGMISAVDWCETRIVERSNNLGLGKSVLAGVGEVFQTYSSALVVEDDIVLIPGAYKYLCAALEHYADMHRVMSVSAWTHARVRPAIPDSAAYFDGRFACWGWGSWRRAWQGMNISARNLAILARLLFRDIGRYGGDMPEYAKRESELNIWAVRFMILHLLRRGLCLYPPYSLVENIGFDRWATHTKEPAGWDQEVRSVAPSVPVEWPAVVEHPDCSRLWRDSYPPPVATWKRFLLSVRRRVKNLGARKGVS